jgi:hypothetical protein
MGVETNVLEGVVYCLRVADIRTPHDRCEICCQQVWGDHFDEWWATKHLICSHCIAQTPSEWIDRS